MLDGLVEFYEPLMTLAYLAAATTRVRLGVSVYVVPYRNPVVTAKLVATLDALSGGRVIFGVGVGWLREEFTAVGADRARARSRDRRIPRGVPPALARRRRRVRRRPLSAAGGAQRAQARAAAVAADLGRRQLRRGAPRAVALGDGLHLIDCRPDEIPAAQTALRSALTAAGRSPDGFTLSLRRSLTTGADTLRDDAAAYARHGLDYLVVSPRRAASVDALAARIADLAAPSRPWNVAARGLHG